jgi:phosphate transport system substrate-binding protein
MKLAALLAAATSCAALLAPRQADAGEVVCAGADTMRGLIGAWGELAHARRPSVTVRQDLEGKLAADGFAALLAGRANCATFVREPFPREIAAFRASFGHDPTLINVANGSFSTKGGTHAIAIYVNAANPLTRLDLGQVSRAFGAVPGAAATWGDLGARGAWAKRPLHVYGMLRQRPTGDPPGVVNYVSQRVLAGGAFRPDIREQVDKPGESALQGIVDRVAEDPDGIGYSGFGFARPGAKALALAETAKGPFVTGSPATVRERRYPLSRRIYILVNRAPGASLDPDLAALLEAALSPAGQAAIDQDPEKFLPLTPDQRRRSLAEGVAAIAAGRPSF